MGVASTMALVPGESLSKTTFDTSGMLATCVTTAARRVIHKRKLLAGLRTMERIGTIGSVGRGQHRRWVMITGTGNR